MNSIRSSNSCASGRSPCSMWSKSPICIVRRGPQLSGALCPLGTHQTTGLQMDRAAADGLFAERPAQQLGPVVGRVWSGFGEQPAGDVACIGDFPRAIVEQHAQTIV